MLGAICTTGLFVLCSLVLKLYWATTFSISVAYAANVNGLFQRLFPARHRREWE